MRKFLVFSIIIFFFFLSGCAPSRPVVTLPTVNRIGRILEQGEKEIGFVTFLYIPTNLSFSYGLQNNWEIQGTLGVITGIFSEFEVYHGELTTIKEILRRENMLVNSSFGLDLWGNPNNNFLGYNLSLGISFGYYPISGLGFYLPITLNFIGHNYQEFNRVVGIFIPGIGLILESKNLSFKVVGNLPSYLDLNFFFRNLYKLITNQGTESVLIGDIEIQPNLGFEINYRW